VWVTLGAIEERTDIGIVAMRIVEPPGLALTGDAIALDVAQMRASGAEITTTLPSVPGANNDAPTAWRDQAGVGEHARCHTAPTRPRQDVAALPHEPRTRFCSVLKKAFGGAEVRTLLGVPNATEFGFEVVGSHEGAHEIREDL
jgi:hypothetical protein